MVASSNGAGAGIQGKPREPNRGSLHPHAPHIVDALSTTKVNNNNTANPDGGVSMLGRYALQGHVNTSASVSTSLSVSVSESVDLEIIDEIIARARDATSFAQVHDAYTQVLEENGIRPSSDKSYYQFLLKLGMIRAGNWGERWAVWRANNDMRLPPPPPVSPQPHPLRARVPFLASASSDIDEGFADGADSDVPAPGPAGGARESPRRAIQRSMVGYTPVPSDADVTPPIRKSTPVSAQFNAYRERARTASTTPRPQTPPRPAASETSSLLSPIGLSTPKTARSGSRRSAERVRERERDDGGVPPLNPLVARQMEAQADAFYRLGLLGRCWGAWWRSSDWLMRTTAQIDAVRNALLVRQTLQRWRAACEFRLAQPGTADAHYAARVQAQVVERWLASLRNRRLETRADHAVRVAERKAVHGAWTAWRARLVKQRTKRWKADIQQREAQAVRRFDDSRTKTIFDAWRDKARKRMADRLSTRTVLQRTFDEWHARAQQSRVLASKLSDWEAQHDTSAVATAFKWWRRKTVLGERERQLAARYDGCLVARNWSQWRVATQSQAQTFDNQRVLKAAFGRLKKSLRKTRVRERKAYDFAVKSETAAMRSAFDTWARLERGRLLQRVLDTRRVRTAFTTWKEKQARVEALELPAFTAASDVKVLHGALNRWRDALCRKRNAALKADLICDARTKMSLFNKWKAASAELADNAATADKAHAFFILRTSLKKWQVARTRRRQHELAERYRLKDLKAVMDTWREATAQSIVDREKVAIFQAQSDKRVLARTLAHWTTRVVELKAREFDVAEQREAGVLREAFRRWKGARKRQADLEALMESSIDIKREEMLRRSFTRWSQRTRKAHDLRQRAEFLEYEHDERLKAELFAKWYDRKRERELRPAEEEAALRHEDALLFAVFDKWTARSRNLTAVQFDQRRVRATVFPRWRRALERHREMKRVAAEHDRRLMVDAFAVWHDAYRAKAARKPQRSRRRLHSFGRDRDPGPGTREGWERRVSPDIDRIVDRPSRERERVSSGGSAGSGGRYPAELARRPRRSLPAPPAAVGSPSAGRAKSPDNRAGSVASEPAYSRLRYELAAGRRHRVASDEAGGTRVVSDEARGGTPAFPARRVPSASSSRSAGAPCQDSPPTGGMSELVRALRYGRV